MTDTVTTINPANEQTLNTYNLLSLQQAQSEVDQCHQAFLKWRTTSHEQRAKLLNQLAQVIESNQQELAQLAKVNLRTIQRIEKRHHCTDSGREKYV